MSDDFSEIHEGLREVARDLLKNSAGAAVDWRLLAESGWLGLEAPDALGGADATFAETAVVLVEMGRAAARSPFLGGVVLGVGALTLLETSPARDALLRDALTGATLVSTALTDGHAITSAAPPFRLDSSGGRLTLSGAAEFVPDGADAASLLLLAAEPSGGPVLVHLPASALEVTDQPVLDATRRFGALRADAVDVPAEAVLRFAGDPAAATMRLFDRAAAAIACDSLGVSEAMLDATVSYAKVREQFGRPIGSFQAVQHACADMLVRTAVSRQLVAAAVRSVVDSETGDIAGAPVSMAKSYACAAAVENTGKAMQLHGGMGYTWESGIHVHLKRAALNRSLFGSITDHRRRLAARYK